MRVVPQSRRRVVRGGAGWWNHPHALIHNLCHTPAHPQPRPPTPNPLPAQWSVRNQSAPSTALAGWPKPINGFYGFNKSYSMGDPRCAYVGGRWFNLVYNTIGNFSWITIGVSNSSNPTGAYKIYNVDSRLIGLVSGCTAADPCFGAGPRGRGALGLGAASRPGRAAAAMFTSRPRHGRLSSL